jgi:hypothetical protein
MRAKILLAAILALTMAACDDDGGGFTPESPFRELSSPENVLNNIAACFNEMNYAELLPIIHDGFVFYIWDGDVGSIPGDLAPDGYMPRAAFLEAAHNMLSEGFIPCGPEPVPDLQIEGMEMALTLSGDLTETGLEGAPSGTQTAYVNLDLQVNTVGTIIYVVHSRPLFYFASDSLHADTEGVTWQLWRVDDGENLNNPYVRAGMPAGHEASWGSVLSLYYGFCD